MKKGKVGDNVMPISWTDAPLQWQNEVCHDAMEVCYVSIQGDADNLDVT